LKEKEKAREKEKGDEIKRGRMSSMGSRSIIIISSFKCSFLLIS